MLCCLTGMNQSSIDLGHILVHDPTTFDNSKPGPVLLRKLWIPPYFFRPLLSLFNKKCNSLLKKGYSVMNLYKIFLNVL